MARRIVITIPDHGELEEHADFVEHVAEQLSQGFTSGHWTSERHWDVTEGTELDDQVGELQAGIRRIVDNWETGDLAGAVNEAAALLPD